MRRFKYPQSFATGVIAAGGTLGIMIPPSTVLAIYGIITEQDIGKLFVGRRPARHSRRRHVHVCHHGVADRLSAKPGFLPKGPKAHPGPERIESAEGRVGDAAAVRLRDRRSLWRYLHRDRSGWRGRRRRLPDRHRCAGGCPRRKSCAALLETTRTTAAVFTILIGALLFGYFLTVTQTPQKVTEFLTGLGIGNYGVLGLILLMYLLLGCLMDALAMIILTVPIIFPVIKQMGFDPIWFGVIIVMTVELGLIHPPVGMNIFVIKSVTRGCEDIDHLLRA